jgi:hypothetical protein
VLFASDGHRVAEDFDDLFFYFRCVLVHFHKGKMHAKRAPVQSFFSLFLEERGPQAAHALSASAARMIAFISGFL